MVIAGAVFVTAALVWLSATLQKNVAQTRGERLQAVDQLLLTTLREEFQLRSDIDHGLDERVRNALEARSDYRDALRAVESETEGVDEVVEKVEKFTALHDRWEQLAERSLTSDAPAFVADQRTSLVSDMEGATARLRTAVAEEQDEDQAGLTLLLIGLSAGLFLVVGGAVAVLASRRERDRRTLDSARKAYATTQGEFAETLQLLGDEAEAHQLVKRHLERTLPDATATILSRNNSANRLEATTEPPSETEVAKRLAEGVEPRACLATRLGQLQERGPDEIPLLPCDLCGAEPGATTCAPLLVSGEVIGAVLVQHEEPLGERDRHRVTESVSHASPVIGNLRNLALAETRAATDALTGLPNRRALQDTVRRMVAQAGRTLEPLAVLALDLDHFKKINDQFGHEKGDDVLAAVGPLLAEGMRESDFAARAGGEEFAILLPGTDEEGAREVAEKLRKAIARLEVPGVERQVTGSFGIAVYPTQAIDAPTLLRKADRALYLAKEHGRDRVEIAAPPAKSAA
jgi:diguanylate cyclase (GGDEF)-like protein